ncbi:rhodanese-like domain-containing protein [Peribacillus alkalitolerans]|uniref:rhodanese-like domain-containing protein n=1 Tax=Peribacillus alkalitolerans TaxID=1550385 RepID=UPI0013D1AB1E|nr:rhodanese-like domain-containing protein [Peribacillus alkalitolerans]
MEEIKTISASEVEQSLDQGKQLLLIDVREDFEVANGMIPGAMHIRMNEIPSSLEKLEEDKEYIIVCAAGVRSEMVCRYLLENGFKAINMEGGMYSWSGEIEIKL